MAKYPLFPLPDTVVFPGMPLPLYIFEPRYKQMIKDCIKENQERIVIVLTKPAPAVTVLENLNLENFDLKNSNLENSQEKNAIHAVINDACDKSDVLTTCSVGSFVNIFSVEENPDGTYFVNAYGQERCKITTVDTYSHPYASIEESLYPLSRQNPNQEQLAAWDALETFNAYAKKFFSPEMLKDIDDAIPEDLLYQASFICANIRVPSAEQQKLLEAHSLTDRLNYANTLMLNKLQNAKKAFPEDASKGEL